MYYKAPDNSLHFLDPAFAHMLPIGSVQITEQEAEALRPIHVPTVSDQLAKLDADNTLTQRNLRESIMLMAQAIKTIAPAVDLTAIPGVAKVFEVEAQATALRAQL